MPASNRTAKKKGAQYELELARFFSDKLGVDVSRSYFTRDPLMRQGEGASDLIGLPRLAVEAKRVETFSIHKAAEQARKNAQAHEVPVVISRRNKQALHESHVVIALEHFVEMYHAWAYAQGYFGDRDDFGET